MVWRLLAHNRPFCTLMLNAQFRLAVDGVFIALPLNGICNDAMQIKIKLCRQCLPDSTDFLDDRVVHGGDVKRDAGVQMIGM